MMDAWLRMFTISAAMLRLVVWETREFVVSLFISQFSYSAGNS
jgi:hypothetical protein